jgi:drug/metabolite transporter (DMT)-like permease
MHTFAIKFLPILLCVLFEICEQLSFAFSARRSTIKNYWTFLGGFSHVAALGSWMWMLALFPLGVALPLTGLNYVGVALASKHFLKEELSKKRWAGIAVILLGLSVIFLSGGSL